MLLLRFLHLASVVGLAVLLTACGKPDLSRSEAEALIGQSEAIQRLQSNVPTVSGATEEAAAQGLIVDGNFSGEAAKQVLQIGGGYMVLQSPTSIQVSVSGIRNDGTDEAPRRLAVFDWKYGEFPQIARRFAVGGGTGEASFSMYDDGFRLDSVSVNVIPTGIALTNAEITAMEADRTRQADKLAARSNYVAQSWTPTQTVQTVSYAESGRQVPQQFVISDTGISYLDRIGQVTNVWFGQIYAIEQRGIAVLFIMKDAAGRSSYSESIQAGSQEKGESVAAEIVSAGNKALQGWRNKYKDLTDSEINSYNRDH